MEGKFKTLEIVQKSPNSSVFHIILNRPSHRNALTMDFFAELPIALAELDRNPAVNVLVISAAGDHFCAGIDLTSFASIASRGGGDRGRAAEWLRREIRLMQRAFSAIELCRKPVIAAVHGGCIGAGVDLATACDLRFAAEDAFFSVKEVDLAITADLGTLQRLPSIVGYGNAVELALTGRRFSGAEAKRLGLVSAVFKSRQELEDGVRIVAEGIGSKSPLAVRGAKEVLLKSREMSVEQGLDYVATWNSAMLISDDLTEAISAQINKRKPIFAKM